MGTQASLTRARSDYAIRIFKWHSVPKRLSLCRMRIAKAASIRQQQTWRILHPEDRHEGRHRQQRRSDLVLANRTFRRAALRMRPVGQSQAMLAWNAFRDGGDLWPSKDPLPSAARKRQVNHHPCERVRTQPPGSHLVPLQVLPWALSLHSHTGFMLACLEKVGPLNHRRY
jgi:hypothetical protein